MRNEKGQFIKGSKPLAGFKKGHVFGKRFKKGDKSWTSGKKFPYKPHPKMKGKMAKEKNTAWKGGVTEQNTIIRKSATYK